MTHNINDIQPFLIGSGGPVPGVHVYCSAEGRTALITSLPAGHSVYTLQRSPDGERIAFGTKAGWVMLVPLDGSANPSAPTLDVAAPILSIAFNTSSSLIVTAANGHCLSFEMSTGHITDLQHAGETPICSLLNFDDQGLVGLSVDGKLLLWTGKSAEQRQVLVQGAGLPPVWAAVRLVYWPAEDAVVWPGDHGEINVYHPRSGIWQCFQAHNGDVYAVIPAANENLLATIGRDDHLLKLWQTGSACPTAEYPVPAGILSVASLGVAPEMMMAIDDQGGATILQLDHHGLWPVRTITGKHFRMPEQVSVEEVLSKDRYRRDEIAHEIAHQINACISSNRFPEAEPLHAELCELGHDVLSCELRVHEAYSQGDLLGQLCASRAYMARCNIHNDGMVEWLLRHAELLEALAQPEEALRVHQQVDELMPHDSENAQHIARLHALVSSIESSSPVIKSLHPIPLLVEAATALDRPFVGCWVWQDLKTYELDVKATPDEVLDMYERRHVYPEESGGDAAVRPLCLLPSPGLTDDIMLVVSPEPGGILATCHYGVRVTTTDSMTRLSVSLLVDTGVLDVNEPAAMRNARIHDRLANVHVEPEELWLKRTHQQVIESVRRVLTCKRHTQYEQRVIHVS